MNKLEDWFGAGEDSFYNYFSNTFKRNTMGSLKFPSSTVKRFNDMLTDKDIHTATNAIAQIWIDVIVNLKYTLLRNIKFDWLELNDQEALKETVCGAVMHAMLNNNVWQRLNSSSISTGSFTLNNDTTSWLLTKDMLGMFAWNTLNNTGIDEYQIISEEDLGFFYETTNGNYKIIGHFDDTQIKELL